MTKERDFCEWVAIWIFKYQNEYNELDGAFCEIACRKLSSIGIVSKTNGEWHFEDGVITEDTTIGKKGIWRDQKITIKKAHGLAYGRYSCSVCKKKQPHKSKFCPECGADMRKRSDVE